MARRIRSVIAGTLLGSTIALAPSREAAAVPPPGSDHIRPNTMSVVGHYTAQVIGCALMDRVGVETSGSSRGDVAYVEGPDRILGTKDDRRSAEVYASTKDPHIALSIVGGNSDNPVATQVAGILPHEMSSVWDNDLSAEDVQNGAAALVPQSISTINGIERVTLIDVGGNYVLTSVSGEDHVTNTEARHFMDNVVDQTATLIAHAGVPQCVAEAPTSQAKSFEPGPR